MNSKSHIRTGVSLLIFQCPECFSPAISEVTHELLWPVSEDEVKSRHYSVHCTGRNKENCGWKATVSGAEAKQVFLQEILEVKD